MILTLASLVETVRQELGRDPARSTAEELVNEAGEAWSNAHTWLYLRDRSLEINLVAGTEDYRLGLGVRSLGFHLERPDTTFCRLDILDYQTFHARRERYLSNTHRIYDPWAAVRYDTKDGDDRPRLYLSVYPATLTERVVATYQAGWLPLNESSDVADIPAPLAQPFKQWVRQYAMGREMQPESNVAAVTAQFFRGPEGINAKTVDADNSHRMIPVTGRVGEVYARQRRYNGYGGRFNRNWTPSDYYRLL